MKKLLVLPLMLCLSLVAFAQEIPILVSAQWVKEHLSDPKLVILQPNFLKLDYDNEHIERGAIFMAGMAGPKFPGRKL